MRARIAAAGAAQAQPVAQQRPHQRRVAGTAALDAATRAQLRRKLVDAQQPGRRIELRVVFGGQPQRALSDVAVGRRAVEHRLARLRPAHGRLSCAALLEARLAARSSVRCG